MCGKASSVLVRQCRVQVALCCPPRQLVVWLESLPYTAVLVCRPRAQVLQDQGEASFKLPCTVQLLADPPAAAAQQLVRVKSCWLTQP